MVGNGVQALKMHEIVYIFQHKTLSSLLVGAVSSFEHAGPDHLLLPVAGIVPAALGQVGEGLHEEELILNILWDGFLGQEFLCIIGLSLLCIIGLSLLCIIGLSLIH